MNIFKKLYQRFRHKKAADVRKLSEISSDTNQRSGGEETVDVQSREVNVLFELPQAIFHPADLMEPLLMAIVWKTKEPKGCSLSDIRLYSLYDKKDGAFVGSCYALKVGCRYYGNIVGCDYIFSCTASAFQFEETNELIAPLKTLKGVTYALRCKYDCQKATFAILQLEKITDTSSKGKVLHVFEKGISFNDAAQLSQELMN